MAPGARPGPSPMQGAVTGRSATRQPLWYKIAVSVVRPRNWLPGLWRFVRHHHAKSTEVQR